MGSALGTTVLSGRGGVGGGAACSASTRSMQTLLCCNSNKGMQGAAVSIVVQSLINIHLDVYLSKPTCAYYKRYARWNFIHVTQCGAYSR